MSLMSLKAPKLFVGGIPKILDDSVFEEYFKKFGDVYDIILMRHKGEKLNRGFGFVTYKSKDTAEKVLSQSHLLGDHKVTTNYSKQSGGSNSNNSNQQSNNRFFIGGLDKKSNLSEGDVRKYFSQFGEIQDILLRVEKGYGFVEFVGGEDQKTIDTLTQRTHTIQGKDVRIEPAKPKERKPAENLESPWSSSDVNGYSNMYHAYSPYPPPPRQGYEPQNPFSGAHQQHHQPSPYGRPPPHGYHHQHQAPPVYHNVVPPSHGYHNATPANAYHGNYPPPSHTPYEYRPQYQQSYNTQNRPQYQPSSESNTKEQVQSHHEISYAQNLRDKHQLNHNQQNFGGHAARTTSPQTFPPPPPSRPVNPSNDNY
eukprot:UN23594